MDSSASIDSILKSKQKSLNEKHRRKTNYNLFREFFSGCVTIDLFCMSVRLSHVRMLFA